MLNTLAKVAFFTTVSLIFLFFIVSVYLSIFFLFLSDLETSHLAPCLLRRQPQYLHVLFCKNKFLPGFLIKIIASILSVTSEMLWVSNSFTNSSTSSLNDSVSENSYSLNNISSFSYSIII